MRILHHPAAGVTCERPPARNICCKRHDAIHRTILSNLVLLSALLGTTVELARTKEPPNVAAPARAESPEDLLQRISYRLGGITIAEKRAATEEDGGEDTGLVAIAMLREAIACTWAWCKAIPRHSEHAMRDAERKVDASIDYLANYHLDREEAACLPPDRLDCNDHAYRHCQLLAEIGIQPYLLSIWPKEPRGRFRTSWHQMAVCKMGNECYLVVDNDTGTLWRGGLRAFVAQYGQEEPMELVWEVGLTKYMEPVHKRVVSKWLIQGLHRVVKEEMETPLFRSPPPLLASTTR